MNSMNSLQKSPDSEVSEKLERAKGFEPSTPTLARSCSTPQLRPLNGTGAFTSTAPVRRGRDYSGLKCHCKGIGHDFRDGVEAANPLDRRVKTPCFPPRSTT